MPRGSGCFLIATDVFLLSGIVQSVLWLASGWMTEGLEFKSQWGQEFSVLHVIQTGSGVHPDSYPMGIGVSFPGGKAAGA
jgi:hypothetical protein